MLLDTALSMNFLVSFVVIRNTAETLNSLLLQVADISCVPSLIRCVDIAVLSAFISLSCYCIS